MKKQFVFAAVAIAAFFSASTNSFAQLQERPQIPREPYSEVVLRSYGEYDREERYAAGCLRWGVHTRTWYDICRGRREHVVSVRY